ncbi:ABC transporter substrate-binding protein, partial [Streptomyces asiaticus]
MSSAVRLIAPRPAERPHRRTRILAAAAVLPLLMGALGACGYGSEKKSDDSGSSAVPAAGGAKVDGLDKVKVGYFANLTHATALVGLRKGGPIQQELKGTKVAPYVFNAGPSEIEALNAGSIDMGWIGPSPSINGYVKSHGSNLKIISGSVSGGVKLVVNPKKIKTLNDVKGKKIATPQLGNTQDVAFLNWVKSKGWKVDAQSGKGDVSVVRSDNKVTPDAYKSGAIDGAWVPEPTASKLVADGGKVLLDESSLWPDKKFVITNLIVKQSFLEEHPKVVEAVLRGSVKTNAFIKANPEQAKNAANAALKEETGKPLPAEVIDPAWKSIQVTDDPL